MFAIFKHIIRIVINHWYGEYNAKILINQSIKQSINHSFADDT